jgi:uncharacterized protein (TIGR00255 family)
MDMIRSMTGFGQAARNEGGYILRAEIRSVNHRYGETLLRLPKEYSALEELLKQEVRHTVKRGRVDAYVTVEKDTGAETVLQIDWKLAEQYRQAAESLGRRFGLDAALTVKDMLDVPGIIITGQDVDSASEPAAEDDILLCFREALSQLVAMREAEGRHLKDDLAARLEELKNLHAVLLELVPAAVKEYRDKLELRMKELLGNAAMDEQRIAMEAAIFAERCSVDEELIRLTSHFEQFAGMLEGDEPAGRKLDFLIQEMNREVNTIGSKANHARMAGIVVEMKAELEKIREQVQNIE